MGTAVPVGLPAGIRRLSCIIPSMPPTKGPAYWMLAAGTAKAAVPGGAPGSGPSLTLTGAAKAGIHTDAGGQTPDAGIGISPVGMTNPSGPGGLAGVFV